jgi:hypothetical protein
LSEARAARRSISPWLVTPISSRRVPLETGASALEGAPYDGGG